MKSLKLNLLIIGAAIAGLAPTAALSARADHRSDAALIHKIETDFSPISFEPNAPAEPIDLTKLMAISNVPGLSVAVFKNYRLAWAKGYGVTAAGGDQPVTPDTLFEAASISKPVSAIALLELAEQGRVSLDEDVNLKLRSWRVPDSAFTAKEKVTLRRILTHTAGTTVHGFIGYASGEPLPTLAQILRGERPANNPPITVDFTPGSKQRYSGGGFMIAQQLAIDVTGESFDRLMRERVIDRLGLKHSTYEQPLSAAHAAEAAVGHDELGEQIPGKRNIQPEMAVGGLSTTPSDLGRIAAEIALEAQGRSHRLLSAAMAREMLRGQADPRLQTLEGPPMSMGLGWMLGHDDQESWFEHSGVNKGFVAQAIMMRSGDGVVVMANSDSFAAQLVMRYLINNVAVAYGWSYRFSPYTPWPYADTVVLAAAKLHGAQVALRKYAELKSISGQRDANGALKAVWTSDPPDYLPNEWDLLGVALTLGDKVHLADAIALLQQDVREYPKFWQGFDYLAQMYERAGDREHAIKAFEKVKALNPQSRDAAEGLKQLQP